MDQKNNHHHPIHLTHKTIRREKSRHMRIIIVTLFVYLIGLSIFSFILMFTLKAYFVSHFGPDMPYPAPTHPNTVR